MVGHICFYGSLFLALTLAVLAGLFIFTYMILSIL